MANKYYLAVDIGASSGRHILGWLEKGKIRLEEIYRFENKLVRQSGHLCWDLEHLFHEVTAGMKKCGELGRVPVSVGIDTWGVDFVLLDEGGNVLGPTVAYRDGRTKGMDEEVYKALERGVRAGKIRSIGISNYYTPEAFERINRIAEIVPAVVQNENHPFYQNKQLQEYLRQYGTVVEAWYPFGGRGNTQKVFQNETIKEIASRHGKTSAQIVLRWQIQDGYIVIPGSGNSQHIAENAAIFDFALSDDDMQQMKELNTNRRFENW